MELFVGLEPVFKFWGKYGWNLLRSAIRLSGLSYAKMIMATTGITRIRVLVTHQIEFLSRRTLPFNPMVTVANAARPLIKAISSAMSPLTAHPSTSTGVEATMKNRTDIMAGVIM